MSTFIKLEDAECTETSTPEKCFDFGVSEVGRCKIFLAQEQFAGGTAHLNLKIQTVSIKIFKIYSRFDVMAIEKLFNSLECAIVMMFMK